MFGTLLITIGVPGPLRETDQELVDTDDTSKKPSTSFRGSVLQVILPYNCDGSGSNIFPSAADWLSKPCITVGIEPKLVYSDNHVVLICINESVGVTERFQTHILY
jgi:hypothetical protein